MRRIKSILPIALLIIGVVIAGFFARNARKTNTPSQRPQISSPTGTPTTSTTPKTTIEQVIAIEGGNFYFSPNQIRAKKGQHVTITFTSKSGLHDFVIEEFNVGSETITSDQSTTVSFTPDKTGTFEFYCSIGRHREMGMKGALIVEE